MATAATPRPGRMLALVGIVLLGLYLGLILGPAKTPRLGLDLRGGTQVILTTTPISGGQVTSGQLSETVNIIRQRIDAAGVGGAAVETQGSSTIIVSAPGASRGQLAALDQTALLRFRQVLAVAPFAPVAVPPTTPTPTVSASASPSPSPSKSTSKKSTKTSHDVLRGSLLTGKRGTPTASATTSPTQTGPPTPTPSPSASTGTIRPAKGTAATDLATVQATFQTWDCSKDDNPTNGVDPPEDYIVACDTGTGPTPPTYKYLLSPAKVEGSQLSSASASIDTTTNKWQVNLSFDSAGGAAWLDVTKTAAQQQDAPNCGPPAGCNAVAIVLDGVVQSAPRIDDPNGIAGGRAQITGGGAGFSQQEANDLANILKFGALPVKLTIQSNTTVSASLGSDQLRGGLIAGAIGLVLVVLYSLLYYRALGLVTVASLVLSGLLLYAVVTLLGHSALGYTLSLPGIAGFIVAVGITADSFVVFFERLRDEVREGKRLRSAVERAWPRARRTILSADTVSLLAAVVLYLVSIGDVRGFAFTLGLSTLSDLFIVFCFTKPLLTLLARRRAFDMGASWTGVGRSRTGQLEPRGD